MALYDMPRSQFGGQPFGGRLAEAFSAVIGWNDRRATRNALSTLSDRELDDIGLVRGDIENISRR